MFIAFAPDRYYLLPIHPIQAEVQSGIGKKFKKWNRTKISEDKQMIDRLDMHPTPRSFKEFDQRSGKDRRTIHTMLDPERDKRKHNRRKNSHRRVAQDR